MSVPSQPLTWEQGTDLTISLVYKEGPPGAEVPIDLTNYAVRMDIKTTEVAGTHIFTFNSEDIVETPPVDTTGSSDNEATLGSAGQINILVPRALTLVDGALYTYLNNNVTGFFYDIILRNKTTNKQIKILKGTITVNRGVTLWA